MDKASDVLGLVASHFAIEEPGLGSLRASGPARREAPPLAKAVGFEETAQGGIGGYGLEIGAALGQRDEVVVMQLYAPAFVCGVLGEDYLTHYVAHCRLLAGIGAQLAPQHTDGIVAL
jgi:hypothetical protein